MGSSPDYLTDLDIAVVVGMLHTEINEIQRSRKMNSSEELYNRLIGTLSGMVDVSHIAELKNWIWIVVGILQAESVALSKIANHIPGETQAESRVTSYDDSALADEFSCRCLEFL
jgi:hypothetical protein